LFRLPKDLRFSTWSVSAMAMRLVSAEFLDRWPP
jgi:hypothetical protein